MGNCTWNECFKYKSISWLSQERLSEEVIGNWGLKDELASGDKKQRLKSTWRLHKKVNLRADSLKWVCMSVKRSQLAQVCVVFSLRTLDVIWFIFKGDGAMRTTLCLDGIHSFVCLVSCLYKDASVAFLGLLQGGPWGWEIHLHNIHSSNICEQMIAIK